MKTTRLIKKFEFLEIVRNDITLGTDTRLNPEGWLQIEEDANDAYPLTADLNVQTWITNPLGAREWIGFEAEVVNFEIDDVVKTSVGYRLSDGSNQYYWNGAAWAVSTTQWNTEVEVATNISSFVITSTRQIQVVINLVTTNKLVTPHVKSVKILYTSDTEFQEDIVFRSLIPSMKAFMEVKGRYQIVMSATGSTIDLNDYPLDNPYDIVGIDAVYNITDDPGKYDDLFLSYDTSTKIITLSSSVSTDKSVRVVFLYRPLVADSTGRDYNENDKTPAINFDSIGIVNSAPLAQTDSVINKGTYTGYEIKSPIQGDIEIICRGNAGNAIDAIRISDEVKRYFQQTKQLRSVGLDEKYDLFLDEKYSSNPIVGRGDVHSFTFRFKILHVLFFTKGSELAYGVNSFVMTFDKK